MNKKKVCIVGCGALGSNFLFVGRNLDVDFYVIDDDRIEQKNLASQFHTKMGLSKNKVQAMQQTMNGLYGKAIKAIPHRLTASNVESLFHDMDLVIDCVDNGDTRTLIQNFVRAHKLPCLHGALAADGQFGSVIWDELFKIDYEDVKGQPTCEGGEFLPFIVTVVAEMVNVVKIFLADGKKVNLYVHPTKKIFL